MSLVGLIELLSMDSRPMNQLLPTAAADPHAICLSHIQETAYSRQMDLLLRTAHGNTRAMLLYSDSLQLALC